MRGAFWLLLTVGLASPALADTACTFPGATHQCDASRGGPTVEWREPSSDHDHELWLRRAGHPPVRLAEFGRSVEVLWSPDGEALAITDRTGSSESTAWVVRIAQPEEREDLELAFNRAFSRPTEIYRHGHRYFHARSWLSRDSLLFEVRAHDATPDGYRGTFVYGPHGGIRGEAP